MCCDADADDKLRRSSLVKLRKLAAAHQSVASRAVECNTRSVGSTSIDHDRSGDDIKLGRDPVDDSKVPSASRGAKLVVPQRQSSLRRNEILTPSQQIINHQPSSLLRLIDKQDVDGGIKAKKRVTFQDQHMIQMHHLPSSKRSFMPNKLLNNGRDEVSIMNKSSSKNREVVRGERSSNNSEHLGGHDDDAAIVAKVSSRNSIAQKMRHTRMESMRQVVSTAAYASVSAATRMESMRNIKDLSLLQVVSTAADATASAATKMNKVGFKCAAFTGDGRKFRTWKHRTQEHSAPLKEIANPNSNDLNDGDEPTGFSKHHHFIASTLAEVDGENIDPLLQTDTAYSNSLYSEMRSNGGNFSGVDDEGGSVTASVSKGDELVVPQSSLLRNDLAFCSDVSNNSGNFSGADDEGDSVTASVSKGVELVAPQSTLLRNDLAFRSEVSNNGGNFSGVDDEGDSVTASVSKGVELVATESTLLRNDLAFRSEVSNNGGNCSGVDDDDGSGTASVSRGVELVAPESNDLVRQVQHRNCDPPLIPGLRTFEQNHSMSALLLKTSESCQDVEVDDEVRKLGQENMPCNVAGTLEHRVDKGLVSLRRSRGLLSVQNAEPNDGREKKYVARLRKLAASHYSRCECTDDADGGFEVALLDTLTDSPKGVDEICCTDQFSGGQRMLKEYVTSVDNYVIDEKEDAIEVLGQEEVYECYGCDYIKRQDSCLEFEGFVQRRQQTTRSTHLRHPRRLASKLIQKVMPTDLDRNSSLSVTIEEIGPSASNSVSSVIVPINTVRIAVHPDSDTSFSNFDSMSAVYSRDQEKMFDRKTCTEKEWVSIPDDIDSVAVQSELTANTDPMDIHDLTSWNFTLPRVNSPPTTTAQDCNYGNDLESAYENFGIEQPIPVKLKVEKKGAGFDSKWGRVLSRSNPVDVDHVSVSNTSLATDGSMKKASDGNADLLVRLDDFGFDWLCGDVNHGDGIPRACPAEIALEGIFDDVGNQISDLLPLCDNVVYVNDENHDCQTEFDGWTEYDAWTECADKTIDDATMCDDIAIPVPKEAVAKTNAIRLQSVLFVAPNVKHLRSMKKILR
jgi:hypothetical protein